MGSHQISEEQLRKYFDDKPHAYKIFKALHKQIAAHGDCEVHISSQISFKVKRKFAWIWLYNTTGASPEGTVQIMLALNRKSDEPPVYRVTKIGEQRWNHLVVIHSLEEAKNARLHALIKEAYQYGAKTA